MTAADINFDDNREILPKGKTFLANSCHLSINKTKVMTTGLPFGFNISEIVSDQLYRRSKKRITCLVEQISSKK